MTKKSILSWTLLGIQVLVLVLRRLGVLNPSDAWESVLLVIEALVLLRGRYR